MLAILAILFILIIIVIIIVYLKFFKLKRKDTQRVSLIEAKDIQQDILIKLSKLERKLFREGFNRRAILKIKENELLFYYYNNIENIHTLIVYKSGSFNYYFITIFENKKILVTTSYSGYISLPNNFIITSSYSNDKLIEHKSEKLLINSKVIKNKLSYRHIFKIYTILNPS